MRDGTGRPGDILLHFRVSGNSSRREELIAIAQRVVGDRHRHIFEVAVLKETLSTPV
jgi:hypothetical protein